MQLGSIFTHTHTHSLSLPPEWGLSESHLTLGTSIGKGEFGEVLTGTYKGMQVIHQLSLSTSLTTNNL